MSSRTKAVTAAAAMFLSAALTAAGASQSSAPTFPVLKTRAELEAFAKSQAAGIKGRVGVYVKHIESGETLGVRENELFQLASVFKIPVLFTLFKQVSLGKLSLDDRVMFAENMKTYGSGLLTAMKPGLNLSVQDLAVLMMARSDNTATDILFQMVGRESVAAYMKELGLKDTTIDYDTRELILAYLGLDPSNRLTIAELNNLPESVWADKARLERQKAFETSPHNTSTPREVGLLLEKCVRGEVVDKETSDRILEVMKHHTGAEIILRYLPMSVEIARKGGSLARNGENTVLLDAGVVWLPAGAGTLVICLFGNDLREVHYELKDKLGRIARAVYDHFLALKKK